MASPDLTTEAGMLTYLQRSHYPQCSSIQQLTGGSGGFTYRATTNVAETPTIVAKHAEGYAARMPEWKLDTNRMDFEARAMQLLSQPEMQSDPSIRNPKLLHYDQINHVLIIEDVGSLPSLKSWVTESVDVDTCSIIGEAIGRFLAHLHDSTANDQALLKEFNGNETAKNLSGKLYFGTLPQAAEKFGHSDEFIKEAARVGEEEVMTRSDVLTFGDFWTGNVLVSSSPQQDEQRFHLYVLDLELSKPGTAEFDIGQMAAEMWCLATFRKGARSQSLALLQGFLMSYKAHRKVPVDASKVAIRIGSHLFVIMPMAWSNEASREQIVEAAKEGRQFVKMGWEKDEDALKDSVLAPLT